MEEALENEEWTESLGLLSRDLSDRASRGELVTEVKLPIDPVRGGGGGGGRGGADGGISDREKKSERLEDN